jgi:hypothetical protein
MTPESWKNRPRRNHPLLDNDSINISGPTVTHATIEGILGSSVFCVVHAEVI